MQVKGACFQIVVVLLVLLAADCRGQLMKNLQGVVFETGTSATLRHARVFNKATNFTTFTDSLGRFNIAAAANDTIIISKVNYQEKAFVATRSEAIQVFLSRINELAEVTIKGQSIRAAQKDLEDAYRDKGIFFKGKPPIYLLSPFGGSPVTFFYELLSKDGKKARRLQKSARGEIEYSVVSRRFNDNIIKSVIPGISEVDLQKFKATYLPKAAQINTWSDYELFTYIKPSFEQYNKEQDAKE